MITKNKFPFRKTTQEYVDLVNLQCLLGGNIDLYKLSQDKKYALITLVSSEESFSALVDIGSYCQQALLDFSFISWHDIPDDYLIELFKELVSDCHFFAGNFHITDVSKADASIYNEPWCYLEEEKLDQLFVKTVPATFYNKNKKIKYDNLTITAKYFMGKTYITFKTLSHLALGDVILITKPEFNVFFGEDFWSFYSFADNGIFMSDTLYETDSNEQQEDIEFPEQVDENRINPSKITIELSFLLDKKKINLLDLTKLEKGAMLPLNPGCESKIKIYANNSLWGYGELIYIEENLGIEISQIVSPIILEQ